MIPEGVVAFTNTREVVVGRFDQQAGESREDYVRRLRDRPGVVANGVTLLDLYDRIGALEARVAELESRLGNG